VLTGTVGTPFSQQTMVSGGDSSDSYIFSPVKAPGDLTTKGLPDGLDLSQDGLLSGVPKQPDSYPITIDVTDTTTNQSAQAAFPLVISPLYLITGTMPSGTENDSYVSGAIIASLAAGQSSTSDESFTFATSGNVPPGLVLTIINGTTQLTGTPTAWGT